MTLECTLQLPLELPLGHAQGGCSSHSRPTTTCPWNYTGIVTVIATAIDTESCSPGWVAENASGLGGQYCGLLPGACPCNCQCCCHWTCSGGLLKPLQLAPSFATAIDNTESCSPRWQLLLTLLLGLLPGTVEATSCLPLILPMQGLLLIICL